MAAAIDEPVPVLERIATLLLNGLFGLGLIARDQKGKASGLRQGAGSFGSLSFVIASLIEAGQMLAFPFSAIQHIWDGTVVRNFVVPMLTVVMPASADVWFGPMVYRVSAFCCPVSSWQGAVGRARGARNERLHAISCSRFDNCAHAPRSPRLSIQAKKKCGKSACASTKRRTGEPWQNPSRVIRNGS